LITLSKLKNVLFSKKESFCIEDKIIEAKMENTDINIRMNITSSLKDLFFLITTFLVIGLKTTKKIINPRLKRMDVLIAGSEVPFNRNVVPVINKAIVYTIIIKLINLEYFINPK
jgi:hypothetical protein